MINSVKFYFPEPTRENRHVNMAEEQHYRDIARDFVRFENLSDLIETHRRFYSGHVSRTARDRGEIIVNIISLAALIVARDPAYERIVHHLPEPARRGARRMKPLWLASRILIDNRQNWHNYAQAAAEIIKRRINLPDVVGMFSEGELDLTQLRVTYQRGAKRPKPTNAEVELPVESKEGEPALSSDVDGTDAIPEMNGAAENNPSVAVAPVVPDEFAGVATKPVSSDAAIASKTVESGAIKLLVNMAIQTFTPLKGGQDYIARFTLGQDRTGTVTFLRPVKPRSKISAQ